MTLNKFIGIGLSIGLGATLLTRLLQPSLVFMPPQHNHIIYKQIENISYKISHKGKNNNKIIIYSHGNAEDLCTIDLDYMANEFNCPVVAYDYPGYGYSIGKLSEENCVNSLKIIVNHIRKEYPNREIILIGRSLGTGVVTQFAFRENWLNPIALLSPFKSIGKVVCDSSIIHHLSGMFKTDEIIDKLNCPIKIIHGTKDNIVLVEHGKYLHSRTKHSLLPIWKNCGHNDLDITFNDIYELLT